MVVNAFKSCIVAPAKYRRSVYFNLSLVWWRLSTTKNKKIGAQSRPILRKIPLVKLSEIIELAPIWSIVIRSNAIILRQKEEKPGCVRVIAIAFFQIFIFTK